MSDDAALPAAQASLAAHFAGGSMSPALAIMLDPLMFERAKQIAVYMSKADGFTPPHLIGKQEACFAVVTRALTWKLDPFAVAQATYSTPGGKVGYEGKLVQAILENSGHIDGPVRFEHYGDWSRVKGKFAIRKSDKGKDYAVATWTREDAQGLGVTVKAKVRGETELREWPLDLDQCFPLNSTLWATDPKTQICYTAVRRFGSVAAPGLMMGVPFDREDWDDETARVSRAKDVTPPASANGKSKLDAFVDAHAPSPDPEVQEHPKDVSQDTTYDPDTGEVDEADDTREPDPLTNGKLSIQWPGEKAAQELTEANARALWSAKSEGKPEAWKRSCLDLNPELARLVQA